MKSDDITGRTKTFEAIVKGENIPMPGIPESFKVLVKELQSLALDVRVLDKNGEEIELSILSGEDNVVVPPSLEAVEESIDRELNGDVDEDFEDDFEDGDDENFDEEFDEEFEEDEEVYDDSFEDEEN